MGDILPVSDPGDQAPGACPECGAAMVGNTCSVCGYSHETPVPAENRAAPSLSMRVGVELGHVLLHIAKDAIVTHNPEELKSLGAAAKSFADALKVASPPPGTVDPTQAERVAAEERQKEQEREHAAAEAEAEHDRALEAGAQQHEQALEQTLTQAAVQPQAVTGGGGGSGGN